MRKMKATGSLQTAVCGFAALGLLLGALGGCGNGDGVVEGPGATGDVQQDTATLPDTGGVVDSGAGQACKADTDCAALSDPYGCATGRCTGGKCAASYAKKGTPCDVPGLVPALCAQSACDGAGSCAEQAEPDGTSCGDQACGEVCLAGKCLKPQGADDGNPCTDDVCKNGQITHQPIHNPAKACDDGDKCTEKDGCVYGKCAGQTAACKDDIACTLDFCDPKTGCVNMPSYTLCEDGNVCTKHVCDTAKGCVAAGTNAGAPCSDGNTCTEGDACDASGQCVSGKNTCPCDANKPCKSEDLCNPQVCQDGLCVNDPKQAVVCAADGDGPAGFCFVWACDPTSGKCAQSPQNEGKACDDGTVCSAQSACQGGKCAATGKVDCDDANPCTADGCDAIKGCTHKPADGVCDDGNLCTFKDSCIDGICKGLATDCNDGDLCTKDHCNTKTGKCEHIPDAQCGCKSDAACDDGDKCTVDKCGSTGQCSHIPVPGCGPKPCKSAADCADGDPCTKDLCGPYGTCANKAEPGCSACKSDMECDDGDKCTKDACQMTGAGTAGQCVHVADPACSCSCKSDQDCGTPDGGACTVGKCNGCTCTYTAKICDDGDKCTADSCHPLTGQCQHQTIPDCGCGCKADSDCGPSKGCIDVKCQQCVCVATPTVCNDNNPCTTDACDPATAQCVYKQTPGCAVCKVDQECDDGDKCTIDKCAMLGSGLGSCSHTKDPNCGSGGCKSAQECDDNDACTFELCIDGKCSHQGLTCSDGDSCTKDSCDPKTGGCKFEKIAGCGDKCASSYDCPKDLCAPSYCVQGQCKAYPKTCNDYEDCTADSCDPKTGQCVYAWKAGCVSTKCKSNADCDDKQLCTYDYCSATTGKCTNTKINNCNPNLGKCTVNAQCDDKNNCTYDQCQTYYGACINTPIANCDPTQPKCTSNAQCDDKKPCTYDICNTYYGTCSHGNIPNCGPDTKFCSVAMECDDKDDCTNDTCHNTYKTCYHTKVSGCTSGMACKGNEECKDSNLCTSNLCVNNKCTAKPISCNDYNPCTNDYCSAGKCYHTAISGCVATKCTQDSECDDQNKCTKDACMYGWCEFVLQPGC